MSNQTIRHKVIKNYILNGVIQIPDLMTEECDFCHDRPELIMTEFDGKLLKAKFCPLCGKKLEG